MTLQEYIEAGNATQKQIAERIGVTPGSVSQWINRGSVPAERCAAVEQATDGKVKKSDLRPDIFA